MQVRYCSADCQKNRRSTERILKYVLPSYATRPFHRLRKTAQSASYQCLSICSVVFRFHPRLYLLCQFVTMLKQRSWQIWMSAVDIYYPCCGKSVCKGCVHSFAQSGNLRKCPYCNSDRRNKRDEVLVEEIMNRVEANDAASISCWLL